MTTPEAVRTILSPGFKTKNDVLAAFLVKYMDYSEEMAKDVLRSDLEQTKELATKVKERLLADKTITPNFKIGVKELDF